jgi:hypothetical protein
MWGEKKNIMLGKGGNQNCVREANGYYLVRNKLDFLNHPT